VLERGASFGTKEKRENGGSELLTLGKSRVKQLLFPVWWSAFKKLFIDFMSFLHRVIPWE